MSEEHLHTFVYTTLRSDEVPRVPREVYKEGDKVLICTECHSLRFGSTWYDRGNPRRRS